MAGGHIFEKFEMLMPVKRFSLRATLFMVCKRASDN